MRPVGRPETSVRNYNFSLRDNPEQLSSQNTSCWLTGFESQTIQSVAQCYPSCVILVPNKIY